MTAQSLVHFGGWRRRGRQAVRRAGRSTPLAPRRGWRARPLPGCCRRDPARPVPVASGWPDAARDRRCRQARRAAARCATSAPIGRDIAVIGG